MVKKCAIIEYDYQQSQFLPSVIHYFQRQGYIVDLFIHAKTLKHGFLELLPLAAENIYLMKKSFLVDIFSIWEQQDKYHDYELIFINSIDEPKTLDKLRNFPQQLMTWNSFYIMNKPLLTQFFIEQQQHFKLASPFSFLPNITDTQIIIPPFFLTETLLLPPTHAKHVTLYLDHFTSFQDAGFQRLYSILPEVIAKIPVKFKIKLFATQYNKSIADLANILKEDGLSKYFSLNNIYPNLRELYTELHKCDCGLFLNKEITNDAELASITRAFTLAKPFFAPETILETVFGNSNCGFSCTNQGKNYLESFIHLLQTIEDSPSILSIKHRAIQEVRDNLLLRIPKATT